MKNLSSSKIFNTLIAFAAIAGGALLADDSTETSGSGCPSSSDAGSFCCSYTNGKVAAQGRSTPSSNACCITTGGGAGEAGTERIVNVKGKVEYQKVIIYDNAKYPIIVKDNNNIITSVVTSPCSTTQTKPAPWWRFFA